MSSDDSAMRKAESGTMNRQTDRYMVVAHNPTIKQAFTKEKLTKRGLVSLSEYYAKVHI